MNMSNIFELTGGKHSVTVRLRAELQLPFFKANNSDVIIPQAL
jgi:hypothetical protein